MNWILMDLQGFYAKEPPKFVEENSLFKTILHFLLQYVWMAVASCHVPLCLLPVIASHIFF